MSIVRLSVEGLRSLKTFEWSPSSLNVIEGISATDVELAVRLLSQFAQSWGLLGNSLHSNGATGASFWHPDAVEVRLFALTAPRGDSELCFGHEVIIERLEANPWWCIGYEHTTLSNDFDLVEVLERMGDRVQYTPPRQKVLGTSFEKKAKEEVTRIAGDVPAFVGVTSVRRDPRLEEHLSSLASWSIVRDLNFGDGAPARHPSVEFGFHGLLLEDGSNLINLLHNVTDWFDSERALTAAMRRVVPGYDGLRFPIRTDGTVGMELQTRDGRRTAHTELPEAVLRALCLYGVLLSPEPPSLLWIDAPERGLGPVAESPLAEMLVQASQKTQVIVSNVSPALSARLPGACKTDLGAPTPSV